MDGTFLVTARFQDSDILLNNSDVEMHFACDFSPFRIQTFSMVPPMSLDKMLDLKLMD